MDLPLPCCGSMSGTGLLDTPMPALDDPEGAALPKALPPVIDAHVHLFPDRVFEALWRWFDRHGWPIRYRLHAKQVIDFQLSRGVEHIVGLHYAHKPGIARGMNAFMATLRSHRVHPVATAHPADPDIADILNEAFDAGLRGAKLHCHVQAFAPDDVRLEPFYATCQQRGQVLVIHAGREPKSPAYPVDTHAVCAVERIEAVLRAFPRLRVCVPHLGADEFTAYARLAERYETLWLDTTMVVADYFPGPPLSELLRVRSDRLIFGTDFPNLPYAWDRELHKLLGQKLPEHELAALLGGNARALWDLEHVH